MEARRKPRGPRKKFTEIPITFRFKLTMSKLELDNLMDRIIEDGIGDWAVLDIENSRRAKQARRKFPLQIIDISTNKEYTLTKQKITRAIRDTLIDFPYALNTLAGYNLMIQNLTIEDIDEIVQIAVFKELRYKFVG